MTGYNGWKNYETWCVNLWLTNDQESADYWHNLAKACHETSWQVDAVKRGIWTEAEGARFALADELKDQVTDASPLADDATMWHDLLGAALCEVDWAEIADNLLSHFAPLEA
jgi:hypothetical protein